MVVTSCISPVAAAVAAVEQQRCRLSIAWAKCASAVSPLHLPQSCQKQPSARASVVRAGANKCALLCRVSRAFCVFRPSAVVGVVSPASISPPTIVQRSRHIEYDRALRPTGFEYSCSRYAATAMCHACSARRSRGWRLHRRDASDGKCSLLVVDLKNEIQLFRSRSSINPFFDMTTKRVQPAIPAELFIF